MNLKPIKIHYAKLNLDKSLEPYIFDNGSVIDLTKTSFINHVVKDLKSVSFTKTFDTSIVEQVHPLLELDHIVKQIAIITTDENKNEDVGFILQIGAIVLELYKDFHPSEYAIYNSLYQLLAENSSWQVTAHVGQKTFTNPKIKQKPIDDVANPTGCVELFLPSMWRGIPHSIRIDKIQKQQCKSSVRFFCQSLDIAQMKSKRDSEMVVIGYNPQLTNKNRKKCLKN